MEDFNDKLNQSLNCDEVVNELEEKERLILRQEKDIGSLKREIKSLEKEIEKYQNERE